MQRKMKLVYGALFVLVSSGCSILNPYSSEFSCPDYDKGKCVTVDAAYQESLNSTPNPLVRDNEIKQNKKKSKSNEDEPSPGDDYQNALYKKMSGMIREPMTPVVVPPQVVRVLFLSYRGENNELYMPRYSYIMVDSPKWIVDNEIVEIGEE